MILSSADILRVLGGSEIIRLSAKLKITDGKPPLSGAEGIYICVDRFPELSEFQATWTIYIESDEEDDLVVAEIQRLLPSVQVKPGLMTTVTTTDFLSENTQRPPAAEKTKKVEVDLAKYEERFQSLVEDVQDRMLLVSSGRPGRDGKDGRDGYDGRDGKDVDATQVELFDLKDVNQSILPMEKGQVLTWDGTKWTNLFVRQTMSAGGSAVSTTGGGGSTGVGSTIGWTYHPHDHTQEPNSGHFHTDSSDGELVTVFHVSNETSRGNDVELLLRDLLTQGYNRIYVALGEDLSQAHLYTINSYTETAAGFEINVTHVETAGLEPNYQNAKLYEFLFTQSAPSPGSVDNVTIISETTPTLRDNGDPLIQGDSWYIQSTDQLFLYINGGWEEIKDGTGVGGVLSSFWKFKDVETAGWDDGKFRVNSHQGKTDWSLTTEIYLAYKNNDGNNVKNYILELIKPGQLLYIQRRDISEAYVIFEVDAVPVDSDPKGATISVSFVTQGTEVSEFTNDKLCGLSFSLVSSGGGTGPATTLASLTDTDVTGSVDGNLLVYRSGVWTSETAPATGLQPGDNVSELVNDAGYITLAEVPASGIPEAPQDGTYYVRQNAAWVSLESALHTLGLKTAKPLDGGNFSTGISLATTTTPADGGNLTDDTTSAVDNTVHDGGDFTLIPSNTIDGGLFTTGDSAATDPNTIDGGYWS